MFLQQVNKHSKTLLVLMLVFIAVQLFINYKHGMVVSPFYSYGMYSEVMNVKGQYRVFEITQNGERLRGRNFSPEQWDQLILPLQYFAGISKSNELYQSDIKRLLTKLHLSANDVDFISKCNYQQFEAWYKDHLEQITNKKTQSFSVVYRSYVYQSNALKPTADSLPISQLCR